MEVKAMKCMRIHYLDASAIVKLLIEEEGSKTLRGYQGRDTGFLFHTTSLCFAEALGVLKVKHFYRKEISEEEYLTACDYLFAWAGGETVLELEDVETKDRLVFTEAERLVKRYKIDVSDAFQIVSVKKNPLMRYGNDLMLITGDRDLAKAARQEGIEVWNCVTEPEPGDI
jgi:predicted nucleic acid-binding protein